MLAPDRAARYSWRSVDTHPSPAAPRTVPSPRETSFPIGAGVRLDELELDPHPVLARLREREPVSWVPALNGWLVTRRDLALRAMRESATFTVDDPRFSTGQVVGPSMLTLDGAEHDRHRGPFARDFRRGSVRERFTALVEAETERLLDELEPRGSAELRRGLAGPLAARTVAVALGLDGTDTERMLNLYDSIVEAVTGVAAGEPVTPAGRRAFAELRSAVEPMLDQDPARSLVAAAAGRAGGLARAEVVSNAAVLMFGGIETTEGMITNAILHLLAHPDGRALVERDRSLLPNAIEESLRLEPAAAVVDRYATRDVRLGYGSIGRGELVTVSIAGANRDPAFFPDPDRFDVRRENARRHVAFAHGPHVCLGMHLARLEAGTAVGRLLDRLPGLRLDRDRPTAPRGLVFRKPPTLHVLWGDSRA
ncbi:MAG: cytochrome P450 [Thermoleophilaceae bacterium]|nr:cytochrome P450 [Thermoleophilaceae bacterium]